MKKYISLLLTTLILLTSTLPISAASGIEIFDATYDYIRPFDGDFASAYRNGEYAIIRKDNAVFYTSDADGFGNYREGMISFYENGTTKIARLNGDTLNLTGYQFAGDYHGAKCAVVNGQKQYGMIDTQGNFLLECLYEDILYDESDTVCVKQNGVWRTVTLNPFSAAARTSYQLADPVFSATGNHIIASNGNGYGILSTDQLLLTEFKYDLIRDASEGIFVAYYGDFVDLITEDGSIAATIKADFVGAYSNGVLLCHDDNGFRYINLTGTTVLVPQIKGLTYMDSFYESYAVVRNSTGYTYMNTAGQQATRTVWDYADRFAGGYALVMNYRLDEDTKTKEQQWYIIDTGFNVVEILADDVYVDSADADSTNFSRGYVRTINRDTGRMGFIRLDRAEGVIVGAIDSGRSSQAITIRLLQNDVVQYSTVLQVKDTDPQVKTFTMENVIPGVYTLQINIPGYLPYIITGITVRDKEILDLTQSTSPAITKITPCCGDINADGAINMDDIGVLRLAENYDRRMEEAGVNPLCDINGDGICNLIDIATLRQSGNYGKTKDNFVFTFNEPIA